MTKAKIPKFMRAVNADAVARYQARTADGEFDLNEEEEWWRDRNKILEDHGYRLRPRLQPGWVPSWKDTDLNPFNCEDSLRSYSKKVVDATRKSTGEKVAIMVTGRSSDEQNNLRHVDKVRRASGENHHIVPILDTFEDEDEPDLVFFVMPLLQHAGRPPFEVVSELVELFKQALEALVYLHSIDVAHRDCSLGNLMMDAPSVYPNGFHPCNSGRDRTGVRSVKVVPRHKASGPVCYYYIDFGISRVYEPGEERTAHGADGPRRNAPEVSEYNNYDTYPVDVWILGDTFKSHFMPMHKNLDFLAPLVDTMTADEPKDRPSAADALEQLKTIASSQSFFTLRQRLLEEGKTRSLKWTVLQNTGILVSAAFYPVRFALRIPSRTVNAVRGFINTRTLSRKKAK